jgi:hypothetical protein
MEVKTEYNESETKCRVEVFDPAEECGFIRVLYVERVRMRAMKELLAHALFNNGITVDDVVEYFTEFEHQDGRTGWIHHFLHPTAALDIPISVSYNDIITDFQMYMEARDGQEK